MKKGRKIRSSIILAALLAIFSHGWGERDVGSGTSAQVDLDLRFEVPSYLLLQIGSPGIQIDTVSFLVNDIPENQPFVEGDYQPPIFIRTNISSFSIISLTADSSVGLTGETATMPFSIIRWEGTGDLSGSQGIFNGATNQPIIHFSGKSERKGNLKFIYRNSYDYQPGIYQGTIIFTLSTP